MSKSFWLGLIKKSIIMFGFTYFTAAYATQSWIIFSPSLIFTGLYFFTELARRYKVDSDNIVLRDRKKKQREYSWLI